MSNLFTFIFWIIFFPYFLNAQSSDYFTDWERVSIESKSLGKVYYKDGKLMTLQPSKGVFSSVDQGRTWQLEFEFHADVTLPEDRVEIKSDGMYLTKNSVIPDAYLSPVSVHYSIDQDGIANRMSSFARQYSFCCSGSLIAAHYGFNGSSAMTTRFTSMGNPDEFKYQIFDGTIHDKIAVSDKPAEQFLGKVGDRYLWETTGSYILLDSLFSNTVTDFTINGSTEFVIIYPDQILVCNKNGSFDLLDAQTLEWTSGTFPVAGLFSEIVLNSDHALRLKIGSKYYHADISNPDNIALVLDKNEEDYEILITTNDWVLGRDGSGKFALTEDMGYTWETYYPINLDYVSKLKKLEDELVLKNYEMDFYASCDFDFLPSTIDLNYETIRFQEVTFQLIDSNIFATEESNASLFQISDFPVGTALNGFLVHNDELFVYGNRLEKINVVDLSTTTETLSFDADKAKSHNGNIYTIKGSTFYRLASNFSEIELFQRFQLHDFFINDNIIALFANGNYYSTDQGNSFNESDSPDIISGSLFNQRELIIGKVDDGCEEYGAFSWDNGITWGEFLVSEVANNPGRYEWSCNGQEQGQVAFGFAKDDVYLYALGGNYGLFRTPLFSNLEAIANVDSTINFCSQEGVEVDNQLYFESDTIFLIQADDEGCEKLMTLALNATEEYFETIDVSVSVGETYLDVEILNDTLLTVSIELGNGCILTTLHNVSILTNTSELLEYTELAIFPNPVRHSELFIEWSNTLNVDQLFIYNAAGKVVHKNMEINNSGKYIFQSANLSQGIYFVQLIGETGVNTNSFLKL